MEFIVSPYWSDISTQFEGSISYEIHTNQTSLTLLHRVSKYIQQEEQNEFIGTWMLVAEWNSVPSPGMQYIILYNSQPHSRAVVLRSIDVH